MSCPAPATTILDLLERASDVDQHGLRFVDRHERERRLSWRAIVDRARLGAAGLSEGGVRPGDRVGIVLPTGPAFFDAFFGSLLCRAIPVPLYPPVRLGRLDEYQRRTSAMLRSVDARLVVTDRRIARVIGEAIERANVELGCTLFDDSDPQPAPSGWSGDDRPPARADDPALIQFSSGTTVDPKPVVLSHRAILAQTRALNSFWPAENGRPPSGVSWLPLYHDMGLIGCVLPALERPATLTLLPPEAFVARPALWLRALSRHRGNISPAPNFAYALCTERVEDAELEGVDLSSWTIALNGAEPVVPATLRAFAERFGRFGFDPRAMTPVYGMSEATLAVSFSTLGRGPRVEGFDREALSGGATARPASDGRELVSVGTPLPGFRIAIVADDGEPAPERRIGRVRVAGPSLMSGYWNRPRQTRETLHGGWLETGDLGFFHDGELFLTGRSKEMLLVRGRNHAPDELERAVEGLDGVRTGCVAAVGWLPEDAERESVALLVETRRGTPREQHAELEQACMACVLNDVGIALDRVLILAPGTLPRTSSGKLRRAEARRRMLDGTLLPPRRAATQIARAWVRSALRRPERSP